MFETTRNIMIVVFLKLVIEEYIKHIGPSDFPIETGPLRRREGGAGTGRTG